MRPNWNRSNKAVKQGNSPHSIPIHPKFIEKIDNRFQEKETIIDLSRPVVAIPHTNNKIEDHAIIDPLTRRFVSEWLEPFRDWILQLNK